MASASLAGFSMTGWTRDSFRPQLPLPPITYPPYCGKGCTCSYFFRAKLTALAFLILGLAFFIEFICMFLPFWFLLKFNIFDSTFGSEGKRQLTADTGLIFYTSDDYLSLLHLEKMSNRMVVPYMFKVAQVAEIISIVCVAGSYVGAGMLACRKYASITGVLFLAALATFGSLGQILMIIFSFLNLAYSGNPICDGWVDEGCKYTLNQPWRNLPFQEQHRRLVQHTTPLMEPNWALYIAIIGMGLAVCGCILLWLEGLSLCRTVGKIRYTQLRTSRDLFEKERHPDEFIVSVPHPRGPARGVSYQGGPPVTRQTYRPPPSESEVSYSGQSSQQSYGSQREPGYNVSRAVNL